MTFSVDIDRGVGVLRISRPPVNAIRFEDWREMQTEVLKRVSEVRVLVITGLPGAHFSAGSDHTEFIELTEDEAALSTQRVRDGLRTLSDLSCPVVAALHGAVMGSGLLMASVADVRIASKDAVLAIPEILAGAFGGYRLMREIMPKGEARQMAWTGEPMSAERAHQLGIVQRLVDTPEEAFERACELARKIGEHLSPQLRTSARQVLNSVERMEPWRGHDAERKLGDAILSGSNISTTNSPGVVVHAPREWNT